MPSNKYWGKVDKAALASLVEERDINISDTSLEYTASVHSDYFSHHDLRNFRRNYRRSNGFSPRPSRFPPSAMRSPDQSARKVV